MGSTSNVMPQTLNDALGVLAYGDKPTVTTTVTNVYQDNGILDLGHTAIKGAASVVGDVLKLADNGLSNMIAANTKIAQESMTNQLDSLRLSLAESAQASQDAIASANASASRATQTASDAMANVSMIADRSQGYAWESAAEALGMSASVFNAAFGMSGDLNKMAMGTVSNIADAYQSARETEITAQFQDYRYILIAGLIVVGIIGFQAVKK